MYKNTGCFLAGTKVSTPEGRKNIEEIAAGEEVYAENTVTGKPEKRKVMRISHQKTNTLVYLHVNESEICSTMEHPFWHKEKGWVKAGELLLGDTLKKRDGEYVKVTYICQEKEVKEQWVYNLEVEGLHSYYVAGAELLVHNGKGVCPSGKVKIESAGKIVIKPGSKFKEHFIKHKKLLEKTIGKKYPKYKSHGQEFLSDIGKLIDEGIVKYIGKGTLKKGQPAVKIYRGNDITVVIKEDGEFVTLLESGEGMDLGIRMID